MESARQKDVIDVMSFQLHVDININNLFIYFPLLKIMTIESNCLKVKNLDLYIIETAC